MTHKMTRKIIAAAVMMLMLLSVIGTAFQVYAASSIKTSTARSYNKIKVSFTKIKSAKAYRIWIKKDNGAWAVCKPKVKGPYIYTAKTNGTYYFKVRAINSKGKLAWKMSNTAKCVINYYFLTGKKVLIDGDSIQTPEKGLVLERAALKLGAVKANITNRSACGATIGARKFNSVCQRMDELALSGKLRGYDYVFISAGTNDFGGYKNAGKCPLFVTDKENGKDFTGTPEKSTVYALQKTIKLINTYMPGAKISVFSPIGRNNGWTSAGVKKAMNVDNLVNRFGHTYKGYRLKILETAKGMPGVKAFDGLKLASFSEMDDKKNTNDRLHPNKAFADTMAERAARMLFASYMK